MVYRELRALTNDSAMCLNPMELNEVVYSSLFLHFLSKLFIFCLPYKMRSYTLLFLFTLSLPLRYTRNFGM